MIYNDLLRGCGNNEFLLEDERFIFNGEEVAVFFVADDFAELQDYSKVYELRPYELPIKTMAWIVPKFENLSSIILKDFENDTQDWSKYEIYSELYSDFEQYIEIKLYRTQFATIEEVENYMENPHFIEALITEIRQLDIGYQNFKELRGE